MLKKFALLALVVLAATTFVAAQTTDVFYVNYFSNAQNRGGYDATVRIVNPGTLGSPLSSSEGLICADIYVFDTTQEMLECCSCPITANGVATMSVNDDLTSNPLTNVTLGNGVIKVVASKPAGTKCTGTELQPNPVTGLRAWATHLQNVYSDRLAWHDSSLVVTEDGFQVAPLSTDELNFLGVSCSFVQYLGSTAGTCTCGTGGNKV